MSATASTRRIPCSSGRPTRRLVWPSSEPGRLVIFRGPEPSRGGLMPAMFSSRVPKRWVLEPLGPIRRGARCAQRAASWTSGGALQMSRPGAWDEVVRGRVRRRDRLGEDRQRHTRGRPSRCGSSAGRSWYAGKVPLPKRRGGAGLAWLTLPVACGGGQEPARSRVRRKRGCNRSGAVFAEFADGVELVVDDRHLVAHGPLFGSGGEEARE